jgi:uncharacterized Zn finger protein (UPF0148 family)
MRISTMEPDETKKDPQTAGKTNNGQVCLIIPGHRLRAGMVCPRCHKGKIEYNGLLNLVCPRCGLTEVGAST